MTTKKTKQTKQVPRPEAVADLDKQETEPFPIVGLGASAGGLEAFESFFKAMAADSGLAFVLVSHLDPSHASILPELLQKKTQMPVKQVSDNMKVKPNHVYIIPPNKEMAILNGSLQLLEMSKPRGFKLPIDTFLRSLAKDQTNNAICIILSGTGTDGTLGLRAIKGEGGMAMVQGLESAKYDGMPRSALATGLADYVLPAELMPQQLIKYTRHASGQKAGATTSPDDIEATALQKIFILLRAQTDHDFSQYKKNTICRRIERRMHVHQIDNIDNYMRYLQESDSEISILFKELLIGVTNFFRDPESFEVLKNIYLPELLEKKPDDYAIRVWVPGCSSGEEAYSIAIILQECMDAIDRHFNVQIFGTDIDDGAVKKARTGLFPESISADVSPQRLKKFFTKEDGQYQVCKAIREMVVFAPQNIIKDPPFTKLDLLCCRNLLIYFAPQLQKKLLPMFHYSLKADGLLFLGTSETIGQASDLFSQQEKKWKIFKRKSTETVTPQPLSFPARISAQELPAREMPASLKKIKEVDTLQLVKTILSQSDLPPSVIINDKTDIVYIHGRIGRFLEPPEGETCINILEMARPGLRTGLSNAIRKTRTERTETVVKNLQVKGNGSLSNVTLLVRPMPDFQSGLHNLMMVIFEESPVSPAKKAGKAAVQKKSMKSEEVRRLEEELQYTKENLQSTIEELETSNEELKSTNEELQSTNEELQSTNEELETSKEELQSLNEESATVNAELQSRIDELSNANDDMKNLLDSTEIATIFLDIELGVRRFTQKVTELIPLTAGDIGRPISHFATKLQDVDLSRNAKQVLADLACQDVMVENLTGSTYRMRMRPYRTLHNVIDGVVITFEDITELKKLYQQATRLAAVVKDSNDAITLLDLKGNIIAWNRGAEKLYGFSKAEALKMNILDLVAPQQQAEVKALVAAIQEQEIEPLTTERRRKDGGIIQVWLTVSRLLDERGNLAFIATTERDMGTLTKQT